MISISALIADPFGTLVFQPSGQSNLETETRRVTRTPTLNGSAVLHDAGFSDADRTLTVLWLATVAQVDAVKRLLRLYARVRVALPDAVYIAAPESFSGNSSGVYTLSLLVIEKESA